MGIAMERPTLCLFGSTRPYLDTGRERARVIYHALDCSPCKRKPTCGGSFDCMRAITPEQVMTEAERLPGFKEAVE
jgi:heptosyltransferase-1